MQQGQVNNYKWPPSEISQFHLPHSSQNRELQMKTQVFETSQAYTN